MTESTPTSPIASTFIFRLRREQSAAGMRWRGQIEHVQSGESAAFLELDAMLRFLRRFGVDADDVCLPAPDEV